MAHENLARDPSVERSSERSFGVVFAAVFALYGLAPLVHGDPVRVLALLAGLICAGLAWRWPQILVVPNRLWLGLGDRIGAVVSPVVTAIMFYGCFAPIGVIMRWCGKDPLRLRRDPNATTYWIRREPSGPDPQSLDRQF